MLGDANAVEAETRSLDDAIEKTEERLTRLAGVRWLAEAEVAYPCARAAALLGSQAQQERDLEVAYPNARGANRKTRRRTTIYGPLSGRHASISAAPSIRLCRRRPAISVGPHC